MMHAITLRIGTTPDMIPECWTRHPTGLYPWKRTH